MVTKIYNLTDWQAWRVGEMLPLPKAKARTVRIEFIAQTATEIRVLTEDQAVADEAGQLIGVIPHGGHEVYEFGANGNILIDVTSDGEVLFYCSENDQWWVRFDDEVIFTKPYERPLVDPAFQHMRLVMMQNMQAMEERLNKAMRQQRQVEPPRAATVQEKEAKPDDGDQANPASASEPEAGEKPGAGPEIKPKAPAGGGVVQPSASGKGG